MGIILIPAIAWWRFRLNAVATFWFAYVVTRPLGASFADYISKPPAISGINVGDGATAAVFAAAVVVLVAYAAVAGHGSQQPEPLASSQPDRLRAAGPELFVPSY